MRRSAILVSALLGALSLSTCGDPEPQAGVYEAPELEAPNGHIVVEARGAEGWEEVGRLEFDEFFREGRLQIEEGGSTLRLTLARGNASHLDSITLAGQPPHQSIADDKLGEADMDVFHLGRSPLVVHFEGASGELVVLGRIEPDEICRSAFHFPRAGGYFRYGLDHRGRLQVDGELRELDDEPFFAELAPAGTGHPTDNVYGWVRHDDQYLYAAVDFTGDNTMDGDKDYASVHIRTPEGDREFKVSMAQTLWGRPGFTYTDKVDYQHKVYELAIPWESIGLDPQSAGSIELYFETYGTCSPCTCPAGEEFDINGQCCPTSEMDASMVCCDFGVTAGVCNPAPPRVGAPFDIKILNSSGRGEHVTAVNDVSSFPRRAYAVGWSSFGVGADMAASWNVGDRVALRTKRLMATYDATLTPADGSHLNSINERGQVVGWFEFPFGTRAASILVTEFNLAYQQDTDVDHHVVHGMVTFSPNNFGMLEVFGGPTGTTTWANDINNNEPPIIVGGGFETRNRFAFSYVGTTATRLDHLDGNAATSEAFEINDIGLIVGTSSREVNYIETCRDEFGRRSSCPRRAFIPHPVNWIGGAPSDYGTFCERCPAMAFDVNEDSWVVGVAKVPGFKSPYNFVYVPSSPSAGLRQGLNSFGVGPALSRLATGRSFHQAIGINNHNQIVGGFREGRSSSKAFLFLPTPAYGLPAGFFILEDLIPTISGGPNNGRSTHLLTYAVDITDDGHIIAKAERRDPISGADDEYYVDLYPTGFIPGGSIRTIANPFKTLGAQFDEVLEDADPVNTFSGELVVREEADLRLGELSFRRNYASGIESRSGYGRPLALGAGWRHEYMWSLDYDDEFEEVAVHAPNGATYDFRLEDTEWVPLSEQRQDNSLVPSGGGFELVIGGEPAARRFDASGRLLSVLEADGFERTLSYSGADLTSISDSFGNTITLGVNGGRIESITDGQRTVSFDYDGGETLRFVTDARGGTTEYVYDAEELISKTLPELNAPISQVYTDGRVTSQTDAFGQSTTFAYEGGASGFDTTITDHEGRSRIHEYNEAALPQARVNENTERTSYQYDERGVGIGFTDALGRVSTSYTHPQAGLPEWEVDVYGNERINTYESYALGALEAWALTGTTYPDGTTDSISYNRGASTIVTLTDRAGDAASGIFDPHGLVTSTTNQLGGTTAYAYQADGLLQQVTNPDMGVIDISHARDANGRTSTVTRPDGSVVTLGYDAMDHLIERTLTPQGGSASRQTLYAFDANGNLESSTDALGGQIELSYDDMDRIIGVSDPDGDTLSYEYDSRGDIVSVVDRNGLMMQYGYDPARRLVSLTNTQGNTWTLERDAIGRLTSRRAPMGQTVSIAYDDSARSETFTDPTGGEAVTLFDAMGRVVSEEDPAGRLTCYTYSPRGQVESVTLPSADLSAPCADRSGPEPSSAITGQFEWNEMGLLAAVVDPNEQSWSRTYDSSGQLASREDPLGNTWAYRYDDMGRTTGVTYPDGGEQEIAYDEYGEINERRYTLASEADEALSFEYDALGRLLAGGDTTFGYDGSGDIVESNGLTVTRDAGGRMTRLTMPSGDAITYTYDGAELARVEDWAGGLVELSYDDNGNLVSITRDNGVDTTIEYNGNNRVTRLADGDILSANISYAAGGRISSIERTTPMLPMIAISDSGERTVDAASQIEQFQHDARGRRTQDDARSYTWTHSDRLASVTEGSESITLGHDFLGLVTEENRGSVTTTHRWSYGHTMPSLVERVVDAESTYFVYTPSGELLYSISPDGSERRYYHFDEQGNTRAITDEGGEVVASYAYLPYGEVVARSEASGLDNPFTFGGRFGMLEGGGGLYHARARTYDATTQRFLSRDAIDGLLHPLLANPYQYAIGDPMSYTDPLGFEPTPSDTYTGSTPDRQAQTLLDVNTYGSFAVEEGSKHTARGLQTQVQSQLARGGLNYQRIDGLRGAANRATRTATRAQYVGYAGTVAGGALEGYRMSERQEAILRSTRDCYELALRLLNLQSRAVLQLVKLKRIKINRAIVILRSVSASFDNSIEVCHQNGRTDLIRTSLESLNRNLAGLSAPIQLGAALTGVTD